MWFGTKSCLLANFSPLSCSKIKFLTMQCGGNKNQEQILEPVWYSRSISYPAPNNAASGQLADKRQWEHGVYRLPNRRNTGGLECARGQLQGNLAVIYHGVTSGGACEHLRESYSDSQRGHNNRGQAIHRSTYAYAPKKFPLHQSVLYDITHSCCQRPVRGLTVIWKVRREQTRGSESEKRKVADLWRWSVDISTTTNRPANEPK